METVQGRRDSSVKRPEDGRQKISLAGQMEMEGAGGGREWPSD